MADLIIKASSNNDLVIQGSDDSPAITVGDTGTTTFAENATLSGTANNLGTVTAGTLGGASVVNTSGNVTAGQFITTDNSRIGKIGQSCRMYLPTAINAFSGNKHLADYAMTTSFNDDATLFTPQTSATKSGIKILVTGKYLFTWSLYASTRSDADGYHQQYLSEVSSSNTVIENSYTIFGHDGVGSGNDWNKWAHSHVLPITANQIINIFSNHQNGNIDINSGSNATFIVATFLHD